MLACLALQLLVNGPSPAPEFGPAPMEERHSLDGRILDEHEDFGHVLLQLWPVERTVRVHGLWADAAMTRPARDAWLAWTDPDGSFVFEGVPAGRYSLYVAPTEPFETARAVTVHPLRVPEDDGRELRFAPPRARIRGVSARPSAGVSTPGDGQDLTGR